MHETLSAMMAGRVFSIIHKLKLHCFALWHFYTLLNHTCNIRNGIGVNT